jgi:hypothetical protein
MIVFQPWTTFKPCCSNSHDWTATSSLPWALCFQPLPAEAAELPPLPLLQSLSLLLLLLRPPPLLLPPPLPLLLLLVAVPGRTC